MNEKKLTGLTHFIYASRWSLSGLKSAWRHESSFRQEVVGVLFLLPCAFWLGDTPLEKGLLMATLLLVLIVELINSAIEAVVDRVGLERHPLSGRAKDLGSAAVMITILLAVLIWGTFLAGAA